MHIPYERHEIMMALISLDDSILNNTNVQDSIRQRLEVKQPELNTNAATFHGITVLDLINSPNYQTLIQQYQESLVLGTVEFLESQGYSNLEAWSVICIIFEVLKI